MKSEILSTKIVHQNPYFRILLDRVRLPDGREIDYYCRERYDAAIVICERDRKLLVVEQDRHRADARLVEFPAGMMNHGETHAQAAARELREETGHEAETIEFVGKAWILGCTYDHVFFCSNPRDIGMPELDASEQGLTHRWIDLSEWNEIILSGRTTFEAIGAWTMYKAWCARR